MEDIQPLSVCSKASTHRMLFEAAKVVNALEAAERGQRLSCFGGFIWRDPDGSGYRIAQDEGAEGRWRGNAVAAVCELWEMTYPYPVT
jgi:hypothetical protein